MDHWKGKVALVTGASAGIGWEIASLLAKKGMRVIAVATRMGKLQELARNIKHEYDIDIYPMACDLRHEEDILKTFKWAFDTFSGIDVLINNAAVAFNKRFVGNLLFSATLSFFVILLFSCSFSNMIRTSLR